MLSSLFLLYFQCVAIVTFLRKPRHVQDGRSKLRDTENLMPYLFCIAHHKRTLFRLAWRRQQKKIKPTPIRSTVYILRDAKRCFAANKNRGECRKCAD